jgi:uncharacterized surface protein with fasciclin (FAS1) repeats
MIHFTLSDSKDLEQLSAPDGDFTVFVATNAAFEVTTTFVCSGGITSPSK